MPYEDPCRQRREMHTMLRLRSANKLQRAGIALALIAGSAAVAAAGVSAYAAGTNAGAVTVTNPDHSPLNAGGSLTGFSFTLPVGAACSGDTAAHFYHVFG